jgi:hypothetical protein
VSARPIFRERLAAIDSAISAIEGAFGDLVEQFDTAGDPQVSAVVFHGWPDDVLANDAKLTPWEVFYLLRKVREAYASDVLGPAERSPDSLRGAP